MKILLLTDIHYGKDINYDRVNPGNVNTFGSQFPSLFDRLACQVSDLDLCITLGDAFAEESKEADPDLYRNFIAHFDLLGVDHYHLIGNHDQRFLSIEDLVNLTRQPSEDFSFDLHNVHHVLLTPEYHGYTKGVNPAQKFLRPEQLDWLAADLKRSTVDCLVYLHYPCDEQDFAGNSYFLNGPESGILQNRVELRKILEDSGKVKAVFNGHSHYAHHSRINGIDYYTIPSFTENDGTGKPLGGYAVVDYNGNGIDVTIESINKK